MTKAKYVIKGKIKGKTQQFSRDNQEDAIGIAENFDTTSVFRRTASGNGLIKAFTCNKGICKEIPIKQQLQQARRIG